MKILMNLIRYLKINFLHSIEISAWVELKARMNTINKFINMKIEELGYCRENDVLFILYGLNDLKKQTFANIIKINSIIYSLENAGGRVKLSRKQRIKLMNELSNASEISNIICNIGNTRDNYIKLGNDGMRQMYGLKPINTTKNI